MPAFEHNSSVRHWKVQEALEKSKNYQKKLEFSPENKWLKIITTAFQYARQNHSEEKGYLHIRVMLDRTSPRGTKRTSRDLNKVSEKAFFVNYWSKARREVLKSTSPAYFKNKKDKHLSEMVRIQLTLPWDTLNNSTDNSLSSTQTFTEGFHVPVSPCASLLV